VIPRQSARCNRQSLIYRLHLATSLGTQEDGFDPAITGNWPDRSRKSGVSIPVENPTINLVSLNLKNQILRLPLQSGTASVVSGQSPNKINWLADGGGLCL